MNALPPPPDSRTARMGPLARLPIFFSLEGRRALVAGTSPAAAWKAELLSAAGARVDVYATDPCEELVALAVDPPRGALAIHRRPHAAADWAGAAIAVGAVASDAEAATVEKVRVEDSRVLILFKNTASSFDSFSRSDKSKCHRLSTLIWR